MTDHFLPSSSPHPSLQQAFTYIVNGPNAIYLGPGDLHESKYDYLEDYIDFTSIQPASGTKACGKAVVSVLASMRLVFTSRSSQPRFLPSPRQTFHSGFIHPQNTETHSTRSGPRCSLVSLLASSSRQAQSSSFMFSTSSGDSRRSSLQRSERTRLSPHCSLRTSEIVS